MKTVFKLTVLALLAFSFFTGCQKERAKPGASTPIVQGSFSKSLPGCTPPVFSYPSNMVFNEGVAITPVYPTVTGPAPTNYSMSPSLPGATGLTINSTTGEIYGTPNKSFYSATFIITASNGTCTSNDTVTMMIKMPFYVYNTIGVTSPPNIYFGSLSMSFKYYTTSTQYGAAVVYSINDYPGTPYPYIFYLPPGGYNIAINPAYSPFPPSVSFIFSGGPSGYGAPGGTWTNLLISETAPGGSWYLKAHN